MSILNPGTYCGKLIAAGLEEVGENRTPAFFLTFSIHLIARDGNWVAIEPCERDSRLFLTDKAFDYSADKLRMIGFNGDFNAPRFNADLYDPGVELTVEHEIYNGKPQEKVKVAAWATGGRSRAPVSADVARTIAAKYRTATAAAAKPGMPPPPPPRAPLPAAPLPPAGGGDQPPF